MITLQFTSARDQSRVSAVSFCSVVVTVMHAWKANLPLWLVRRLMYGQLVRRAALQDKTIVTRPGLPSELKKMNLLRGRSVHGGQERRRFWSVTDRSTQRVSLEGKRRARRTMGRAWFCSTSRTDFIIGRAQCRRKM